eukprot:gene19139-biopygen19405
MISSEICATYIFRHWSNSRRQACSFSISEAHCFEHDRTVRHIWSTSASSQHSTLPTQGTGSNRGKVSPSGECSLTILITPVPVSPLAGLNFSNVTLVTPSNMDWMLPWMAVGSLACDRMSNSTVSDTK